MNHLPLARACAAIKGPACPALPGRTHEGLFANHVEVSPGIIYPTAPRTPGLRERVEEYLDEHGAPAYWYDEIATAG